MGKEWQKVRKSFHYPQLPQPRLIEDEANGSINMESLEVTVSEPFIKNLEAKNITSEESLNEVLTHEVTHYMKFPGSVLNILKLQKSGQGVADGDKISELRTAFTEAQTNLYQLNELKSETTAKVRKACGLPEGDSFGRLMYELYQEISGQDFGVESKGKSLVDKVKGVLRINPTTEEKSLIEKLKNIDYTNKKQETNNFRQFAQVLKNYQPPQDQNKQGDGNQKGEGNGQGQSGGQGKPCPSNGLNGFDDNQIREGLKQFAQECSNPQEYEEIVKQVLDEDKKQGKSEQGQGQPTHATGRRAGSGKGITQLADNFYTALAEKYVIPIRKKPMHKNGTLYPFSHTSFEIGDSITDVDAFSTPGILPGITKKWVKKEGEVYGDNEAVPNSFLIIDNSGSMPSPIEGTSIPVLGATAISNAYLHNGSKVAVYNFGGNDYLLQSTKDKGAVHQQLRVYTGGGTTFNPKFLEGVLKDSGEEYDISVISDMEIRDLGGFIDTVLGIPKTHRVHLLYTENNSYVNKLRQSFGNKENVAILPLTRERDIQEITMGELKKSVK